MNFKDTICYKVDKSIEEIEQALKTRNIDLQALALRLNEIRHDAQAMENAIKRRKKVMATVAGLEEEYKGFKARDNKSKAEINPHEYIDERREPGSILFEIVLKDKLKGEIIYKGDTFAGVLNIVERIDDIDKDAVISGQTQNYVWGHEYSAMYAYDQLRQSYEGKAIRAASMLGILHQQGDLNKKEVRKHIVKMMNGNK